MSKCGQCGKDTPWYKLFPRKSDNRNVCTECSDPPKRGRLPVNLVPRRKQPAAGDPELQGVDGDK